MITLPGPGAPTGAGIDTPRLPERSSPRRQAGGAPRPSALPGIYRQKSEPKCSGNLQPLSTARGSQELVVIYLNRSAVVTSTLYIAFFLVHTFGSKSSATLVPIVRRTPSSSQQCQVAANTRAHRRPGVLIRFKYVVEDPLCNRMPKCYMFPCSINYIRLMCVFKELWHFRGPLQKF